MSSRRVNKKIIPNTASQSVPGTPIQQMWHVLKFHEQRITQFSQLLEKEVALVDTKINDAFSKYETNIQVLLQRVAALEKKNTELVKNQK